MGGDKDVQGLDNSGINTLIHILEGYVVTPLRRDVFGSTLFGQRELKVMVSGLMHKESVKVFFLTGILGFLRYIVFLVAILRKVFSLNRADHFLGFAALCSFAIFSFTTTPLIYAPYLYFLIPVLACIAVVLLLIVINKKNG